jgi:hypothetical protein
MSGEILPSEEHALKDFEGTYVGFGPSDESAVGMGELSITIDGRSITSRYATGLEVQTDVASVQEAVEALPEEITPDYIDTFGPDGVRVFKVGHLQYIFLTKSSSPEEPALLRQGSMGDILGPTVLFSPEQVEQGVHEKAFKIIEMGLGKEGDLPRLETGGVSTNTTA